MVFLTAYVNVWVVYRKIIFISAVMGLSRPVHINIGVDNYHCRFALPTSHDSQSSRTVHTNNRQ